MEGQGWCPAMDISLRDPWQEGTGGFRQEQGLFLLWLVCGSPAFITCQDLYSIFNFSLYSIQMCNDKTEL